MIKNANSIGYSLALFSIAKDENKVKKYLENAKLLQVIFLESSSLIFINMLNSQTLPIKIKDQIIDSTFENFEPQFKNFLKLLASKNKFKSIKKILDLFVKYCYENLKIKEGIIYSSSLLKITQIKQIEDKISNEQGYQVSLKNLLDKELISGIKIIIENTIIENSIISELEEIKRTLKEVK